MVKAYFKVAHDEKHAFIVQIGDLEVKVLGTLLMYLPMKMPKT